MSIEVTFSGGKVWKRCSEDGSIWHQVGYYEFMGKILVALQCPRCQKVTLTDDEKPISSTEAA